MSRYDEDVVQRYLSNESVSLPFLACVLVLLLGILLVKQQQWMVAQTPTTLAIRPIVTSKHFEICQHSLLLFALLRTFRVSDSQLIIVDAKYRSTFFVADMVIPFGRYGLFVWPMWLWPIYGL